jgi:hypothetical protein
MAARRCGVGWQLRVVGPGKATIGPLLVSAEQASSELPATSFECTAPPGKTAPELPPVPIVAPSGLADSWALPSAHRVAGQLWVKMRAGDRVEADPPLGTPNSHLELRQAGETQFTVQGWVDPGSPVDIRVVRAGGVVWQGPPE